MTDAKSTIPGLADTPARYEKFHTPYGFLAGRKKQDGAEGLWRINDKLYNLDNFAKNHPGGKEWIELTQGTDITEIFESHHISEKARSLLPKFFVRNADFPRTVPLTFEENGFYTKFRKRAFEALKDVDFHHPSWKSNFIADFIMSGTLVLSLTAAVAHSYLLALIAGIFLTWTAVIGHNYFHQRDNFRMYYFDLILMSSKEWRITHVLSHHMYPNTSWDHEIYAFEPFMTWYPKKNRKSLVGRYLSQIYSPLVWALTTTEQGIKRYYSALYQYREFEFRDFIPLVLPILMCFIAPSVGVALRIWYSIILTSSFFFMMVGLNAAHHHPDIFHDGDNYRKDMDWGLLELDAVRGRNVVDDNSFLVLTNFGSHVLHHLLPTVDHCYLPLCLPALYETCREFDINLKKYTQWELIKGQFQQLTRTQGKSHAD